MELSHIKRFKDLRTAQVSLETKMESTRDRIKHRSNFLRDGLQILAATAGASIISRALNTLTTTNKKDTPIADEVNRVQAEQPPPERRYSANPSLDKWRTWISMASTGLTIADSFLHRLDETQRHVAKHPTATEAVKNGHMVH